MKKIISTLLITLTVLVGTLVAYKGTEVQAHYAMPHAYPGYLIKYNPTFYDVHVKVIQEKLNSYGDWLYDCGTPDGIFGDKTRRAVTNFQDLNGLDMDGIIGSMTWNRIMYGW